jgi:murein endopeptidase
MAIFMPQKHLTLKKELPVHPDYGFWDPKINFNSRLKDPIISLLNPLVTKVSVNTTIKQQLCLQFYSNMF